MLYLDTETFSETPINNGTYRYAEDCEVMIITYAFDNGPIGVVDLASGDALPAELHEYLTDGGLITCHNTMFDRNVLKTLGYHIAIERFRCTMVRAMMHGLPGSLDKLCDIFKITEGAKHKDGRKLIHLFCKPNKGVRNNGESHPKEWEAFIAYASADISAMRQLDAILPRWNYTDGNLADWFLDQRRNDRGAAIDVEFARAALRAVDKEGLALKARTQELTEGELESTTKRDATLNYMLEAFGVSLPDLTMATVQRRIDDPDLPREIKELLEIRLQASTTSTAKYKSMLKAVNRDGRVRGLIQFCGAIRTGRDAGRTIQVQNFPSRGLMPQEDIDAGLRLIKADSADLVYDNISHLTSSCLRATLIAPQGKKLVAADLSNIEGRYLAWAAGEEWKLQAFRDFDAGVGPDLYKLAYAKSFKIHHSEVDKAGRQVGKVQELALGFAGGVGAFMTFAGAYQLDLEEMGVIAYDTLPEDIRKESEGFYEWTVKQKRTTFGLSKQAYVVCESFKRMWRQAHPATVNLWDGLEDITRRAIETPNAVIAYGRFSARRDGQWLRLIMPSGRNLCFPHPRVDDKGGISFMGVNQYTRKWERIKTFGGKLTENVTQAGARDVFKHGEHLADSAGYATIFPVHDELVTEVEDSGDYSAEGLSALMATVPVWAKGLPLAAEGFEAYRYRK